MWCDKNFKSHDSCPDGKCDHNIWYDSTHKWGLPKYDDFLYKMKINYNNKIKVGNEITKKYIEENFSIEKVGNKFYNSIKTFLKNKKIKIPSFFKEIINKNLEKNYYIEYY